MRYVCMVCGYVYDEAKEKVPFESLPDTWKCPVCGAAKSDFEPVSEPAPAQKPASAAAAAKSQPAEKTIPAELTAKAYITEHDIVELTPGQLAALCSNLARGCEKQYKSEEAGLFRQLADYFASITPAVNDASVESLAALLKSDVTDYTYVRAAADDAGDRGAARICVWGEKVTRMLSSLANKYLSEGEQMLADTNVWVCTVCGFVYVGDNAPDLCPVCKVPSWKFEKIEGRE